MSKYLVDGFKLLTRNLDLFLISLFLGLVELLLNFYIIENVKAQILSVVTFILMYFGVVYSVLLPAFFKDRKAKVKISLIQIFFEVLKHSKKLFLPFLAFFVLIILALIIIGILIVASGQAPYLISILKQPGFDTSQPFSLVMLAIGVIFFPLTFFGIFYSVEKFGVIASVKKSFRASIKHIKFVLVLVMLSFLTTSVIYYLPSTLLWSQALRLALISFINIWLYSTSLLMYYQREVEGHKL